MPCVLGLFGFYSIEIGSVLGLFRRIGPIWSSDGRCGAVVRLLQRLWAVFSPSGTGAAAQANGRRSAYFWAAQRRSASLTAPRRSFFMVARCSARCSAQMRCFFAQCCAAALVVGRCSARAGCASCAPPMRAVPPRLVSMATFVHHNCAIFIF